MTDHMNQVAARAMARIANSPLVRCGNGDCSNKIKEIYIRSREWMTTLCEDCRNKAQVARKIAEFRTSLPGKYQKASLKDWDPPILDIPSTIDGLDDGILIVGKLGSGKTHLAAAVLASLSYDHTFNPRCPFHVWMKAYRVPGCDRDELEDAIMCRVCVLDDLGSERTTDYASESVFGLIDTRMDHLRPTIITASGSPESFKESDPRLYDRLKMFKVIYVDGESRRGVK